MVPQSFLVISQKLVFSFYTYCDGKQWRQAECLFAPDHLTAYSILRCARHSLVSWRNTHTSYRSWVQQEFEKIPSARLLNYGPATQIPQGGNPALRFPKAARSQKLPFRSKNKVMILLRAQIHHPCSSVLLTWSRHIVWTSRTGERDPENRNARHVYKETEFLNKWLKMKLLQWSEMHGQNYFFKTSTCISKPENSNHKHEMP